MTNRIRNAEDSDVVLGAKAIGAIIGETQRQAFALMSRGAVPCWKEGGRYAASRAELGAFMANGGNAASLVAAKRRADLSTNIASEIMEELERRYRQEIKDAGADDSYKRMPESTEYVPPSRPLARDVARLLVGESFPRLLWERHHRADAPHNNIENPS